MDEETEEHISAWRSPWILSIAAVALTLVYCCRVPAWERWQDYTGEPPVQRKDYPILGNCVKILAELRE